MSSVWEIFVGVTFLLHAALVPSVAGPTDSSPVFEPAQVRGTISHACLVRFDARDKLAQLQHAA